MSLTDGILGNSFGVMTAGLDGLAMRQRVHTENLANINTDGYQAQTVNFEGTLRQALAANESPAGASPLGAGGAALPNSVSDAAVGGRLTSSFSPSSTGKAVDGTHEAAAMAEDSLRYRVLSQQVTNRFSELRSVISEMGRG